MDERKGPYIGWNSMHAPGGRVLWFWGASEIVRQVGVQQPVYCPPQFEMANCMLLSSQPGAIRTRVFLLPACSSNSGMSM